MRFLHRVLPTAVASITGVVCIAVYWSSHPTANAVSETLSKWGSIVLGFALILGLVNLLSVHWAKIRSRSPGSAYSFVVFVGFALTLFFGLYNGGKGPFVTELADRRVDWLYNYIQVPCSATMFSLLAFFIASAAYRAFRAKTFEATVLLLAALVVMIGRIPIGNLLGIRIPQLADWLLDYPNMAVKRAILIGMGLGIVATSLRIILGVERTYLGGE